ncbi:MAG: phage protease [Opitutales bacterium]|jgi:hypothetical protein
MDLIRIVEYGEHPHPKGLQRVSFEVAQRLEQGFHSLRGRLARRFGGLPVFVGHPDDPDFAGRPGHGDSRAHAWIVDLRAQPDGLYALLRWSRTGREFVENANYKFFSPRWVMRGVGDGVFEPVRLISVGLTNTPNIPGEAISNCAPVGVGERCVSVAVAAVAEPVVAGAGVDSGELVASNMPASFSVARTAGLGSRRAPFTRQQAIVDAVHARMGDTGEDFSTSWANIKRCRQDLF